MAHSARDLRRDCYAAVDIGASSGRVVVGFVEDGRIHLEEVHRFDNRQVRRGGHDCWDIDLLYGELVRGLALCKEAGFAPKSIGIDTWGVDFVLLDADDNLVGDAVAYRDERTQGMFEVADAIMSPKSSTAARASSASPSTPSISSWPCSARTPNSWKRLRPSL
mgnify:CR=1 FL=1